MSSSRVDGPVAAAVLACLFLSAGQAFAGFTVKLIYLDPNGSTITTTGKNAAYSYYRRTLYRTPQGPGQKSYRDDETRLEAFSFLSARVQFQQIREVRFEWREESGKEHLVLDFTMISGERFERSGTDLEGADHPVGPAITYSTPEGEVRLPLEPVSPAEARKGHPLLVRMEFPNNPDHRRPPRR